MTYIVTDPCIKCKYMDCVEVCPVDCFYEGENFLVINPDECIDCGVCEPECPVDAIKPDVSEVTYYRWRQEFGGLKIEQVKRLKELELENSRLRKAVSDLTLDKLILQEAARGNF